MSASPAVLPQRHRRAATLRQLLSAAAAAFALACSKESPVEPELKPAATALTVAPTTLQFAIPRATPGTLIVTTQGPTEVTASVTGSCAAVAPPTTTSTKGMGSAPPTATFTVTALALGTCTVRLADRKGREASVPVTVVASAVQPQAETVAASLYHSCALDTGGAAYCWGVNDQGRLGDGACEGMVRYPPAASRWNRALPLSRAHVGSILSHPGER